MGILVFLVVLVFLVGWCDKGEERGLFVWLVKGDGERRGDKGEC